MLNKKFLQNRTILNFTKQKWIWSQLWCINLQNSVIAVEITEEFAEPLCIKEATMPVAIETVEQKFSPRFFLSAY